MEKNERGEKTLLLFPYKIQYEDTYAKSDLSTRTFSSQCGMKGLHNEMFSLKGKRNRGTSELHLGY